MHHRFAALIAFFAAIISFPAFAADPDPTDWDALLEQARGQEVYFNAWGGAPTINAYIDWVGTEVQKRFGITLNHVKISETGDVVTRILAEKAAGRTQGGAVDLIWINGENFAAMKRENLLLDFPWAERLPNYALADIENKPILLRDFTTLVDGQESPWGTAQLIFYYDSANLIVPPTRLKDLSAFIANVPGRFAYPAPPDFIGTTFLKEVLYGLIDDPEVLARPVDPEKFDEQTAPLWAWLDRAHPNLWRSGRAFPTDGTHLQTLLGDGETDIAITFNPGGPSAAIAEGILPDTVRSYVLEHGSIANAHFVAIPFNASAKAAAMVVANFLLSPEAQARKADEAVWGDPTVLAYDKLSPDQKALFDDLDRGPATLSPAELGRALSEPDPSWTQALEAEWQRRYGG